MAKHLKGKNLKKQTKQKTIILLQIFFTVTLIISLTQIIKWVKENHQNQKIINKIEETIIINDTTKETEKYNINFQRLKQINTDTIAWLKINGTNIEYPVVKTNNNDYYLNHNLEKKYNQAGWVFADYRNKFNGSDKNIVIYAHNRKDGSMFGTLKNSLTPEWYENEKNRKITLITENENSIYEVFSVYQIKEEDYYINTDFINTEFSTFIKTIKERSIKNFNVEVSEQNNILTLSTCAENNKYRVVLHAKK